MKSDSHIIREAKVGNEKTCKGDFFWDYVVVIVGCNVQKQQQNFAQNFFIQHDDSALFAFFDTRR